MNELIKIKQLPILEEQFKQLGAEVDEKVDRAVNMVVNDQNYKDIKKIRAGLNKEKAQYADEFKAIKKEVLGPWEAVEEAYKENIAGKYKKADEALGEKVRSVEGELKEIKKAEIVKYFEELRGAVGIDFITFKDADIKVGLADSKKSLKEKAKAFVDRVVDDLALINSEDESAEILVEYKKDLNASAAITKVRQRQERIRRQEEELKALREKQEEEKAHEAEVKSHLSAPLKAPAKKEESKKKQAVTFRVFYEKPADLVKLAKFLKNNYDFEQI